MINQIPLYSKVNRSLIGFQSSILTVAVGGKLIFSVSVAKTKKRSHFFFFAFFFWILGLLEPPCHDDGTHVNLAEALELRF